MDPVAPQPTLPAACAECVETTIPALPGAQPLSSIVRRFRAADGRLRVDYATFSMLTDPATGERILLNHATQEARIVAAEISISPGLPIPAIPGLPTVPAVPPEPNVVALGKAIVDGLEVEGVRHVFGAIGSLISSWEMWANSKLQMPVFTQTIGSFGVRTCVCKCVEVAPPASAFQIPDHYRVIRGPS